MSHIHGAKANGPWTSKPPTPPPVLIPTIRLSWTEPMKVVPSYQSIDPASLSREDLDIITQNGREQIATDNVVNWNYSSRRVAQQILDFLYLGPSTVVRDREWLRKEGITMLLVARDAQQASLNFMGVDKVAKELGIEVQYVDVAGYEQLVSVFPVAIKAINDHMLRVFRDQAVPVAAPNVYRDGEEMVIDQSNFKRGKILVFCETGNDRSATIVIAYLMAVLGMSLVNAFHFVTYKRFCICIDDTLKRVLNSYEELLVAERIVHKHELQNTHNYMDSSNNMPLVDICNGTGGRTKTKRRIDETFDEDDDASMMDGNSLFYPDQDRFVGRPSPAPFIDSP